MEETVVRHEFTNHKPNVKPFAGNTKCGASPDIEGWIKEIENFLQVKRITDGEVQLCEAKQFMELDPEKGDLGDYVRCAKFQEKIGTWDELKKFLRKKYATVGEQDPVIALAVILNKYKRGNGSFKEIAPKSYEWIREFENLVSASNLWSQGQRANRVMSVKSVAAILRLSLMLSSQNPAILRQIKKTWGPEDDREDIEEELKRLVRDEGVEHLLALNSKEEVQRGRSSQRPERDKSRTRSFSRSDPQNCYQCGRYGHWAKDCNIQTYCKFHKSYTHNTKDCNLNRPYGRGYGRGWNNNRRNGRGFPRRGFQGRGRGQGSNQQRQGSNQHRQDDSNGAASLRYEEEHTNEDFQDVASLLGEI